MSSPKRLTTGLLTLCLGACGLLGAGCPRGELGETADGPTRDQLLAFYSPRSLKILPFTKPRSFDDDAIPDGVNVSLRLLDAAGDPVKAYGTFLFELYEHRPASGTGRGDLLLTWSRPVVNLDHQRQFWEKVTATYEFQLGWEGQPLPPQRKYVLAVSFQAPGGERLFDEYTFEFRVQRTEILEALTEPPAGS